jgi:hypothetical protein
MRVPPRSMNWIPFHNSSRRPSWGNFWKSTSHNPSSLSGGVSRPPFLSSARRISASADRFPEERLNEAAGAADATACRRKRLNRFRAVWF